MNKTTAPSADQLTVPRFTCLTSEAQARKQKVFDMTNEEILAAKNRIIGMRADLFRLSATSGAKKLVGFLNEQEMRVSLDKLDRLLSTLLMTNEEIFDAENLIAGMKVDECLLTKSTDEDELPSLVLEKVPRIVTRFREFNERFGLVTDAEVYQLIDGFVVMVSLAEMVAHRPDCKAKLIHVVQEKTPAFLSKLDEIEQQLFALRQGQ